MSERPDESGEQRAKESLRARPDVGESPSWAKQAFAVLATATYIAAVASSLTPFLASVSRMLSAPHAGRVPVALTVGVEMILERVTIEGADHVPHVTVPERYVELITDFTTRTQPARAA